MLTRFRAVSFRCVRDQVSRPEPHDDRVAQPRINGHAGHRHPEHLTRPAVVRRRAVGDIEPQRRTHPLVMAVNVVRPPRNEPVHVPLGQPRVRNGVSRRHRKHPDGPHLRHLAEGAVSHPGDGVLASKVVAHGIPPGGRWDSSVDPKATIHEREGFGEGPPGPE